MPRIASCLESTRTYIDLCIHEYIRLIYERAFAALACTCTCAFVKLITNVRRIRLVRAQWFDRCNICHEL